MENQLAPAKLSKPSFFSSLFSSEVLIPWLLSQAIVFFAIGFSDVYLETQGLRKYWKYEKELGGHVLTPFHGADSPFYLDLSIGGYEDPASWRSDSLFNKLPPDKYVVFFPGYPGIIWLVHQFSGLSSPLSALLISHMAFYISLGLLNHYWDDKDPRTRTLAIWILCLWPPGVFFRCIFTESLYLCFAAITFLGIKRCWPLWVTALFSGATTAIRVTGVGVALAVLGTICRRFKTYRGKILGLLGYGPLAMAGLLGFMTYQWVTFDDPLLFGHNQQHFAQRKDIPASEWFSFHLSARPFRDHYQPKSEGYWKNKWQKEPPWYLSLQWANPIYVGAFLILLGLAIWRRWLTLEEALFCLFVILFPYFSHTWRARMTAQARYDSIAFPIYFVMARLLIQTPIYVRILVLSAFGAYLGVYVALQAAGYYLL